MNEMIERVARAIADADMEDFMEDAERYIARARAAIAAIREHEFGSMILSTDAGPAVTISGEAPTLIFRALLDGACPPSSVPVTLKEEG
jgi:hypothetical protein